MRLVARHRLIRQGSTVEAGAPLEARGAAQERRLYSLWLRGAVISETAWHRARLDRWRKPAEAEKAPVPLAEPPVPVRPGAVGRRPGQPR